MRWSSSTRPACLLGAAAVLASPMGAPGRLQASALNQAGAAAGAGQPAEPTLRPKVVCWDSPVISTVAFEQKGLSFTHSPSGNAGSFILTGLELSLQNQTADLSGARSVTFRSSIKPEGKRLLG